jgi:hypothetical protein
VLACDGIWDCMTNQEVVDFVQTRIAEGKPLEIISEQIIDYCLAPEATLGAVGIASYSDYLSVYSIVSNQVIVVTVKVAIICRSLLLGF